MKHIIITGASRGLGKALTIELAGKEVTLHLIGRDSKSLSEIQAIVSEKQGTVFTYVYDLAKAEGLESLYTSVFRNINRTNSSLLVLINNAGVIRPIGFVGTLVAAEISHELAINCGAVFLSVNSFLKMSKGINCERRIINISSGAALHPITGWGVYCASKAAINSFTVVVAEEQSNATNPAKIVSFDPGVMATDMQEEIRNAKFPDVARFIEYQKQGQLRAPQAVAKEICNRYIRYWRAKSVFERINGLEEVK